ncbi:hypothetical protein Peur_033571 [Populus x canadensis]
MMFGTLFLQAFGSGFSARQVQLRLTLQELTSADKITSQVQKEEKLIADELAAAGIMSLFMSHRGSKLLMKYFSRALKPLSILVVMLQDKSHPSILFTPQIRGT